ncbi:MAG: hypothetical protein U0894_09445 [Pirellulales bacterium]
MAASKGGWNFLGYRFGLVTRTTLEEENPIYGTAKVLKMGVERNLLSDPRLLRGARWLASVQNANGTFGSSLEETALATEMLGSLG